MKKYSFLLLIISFIQSSYSQTLFPDVVIETTMGNIKIGLYDNTPLHSKNFVKLVNEGYFNGQLFHRVITNFMIQAGDEKSINAPKGKLLGNGGKTYTIPAEFYPSYYHKKGALAAARKSDNINPKKESSGSQFYIVQGQKFSTSQLDYLIKQNKHKAFTPEQITDYTTLGGTPFLDDEYTVFGEVLDGWEVVEKITLVATDANDRPVQDVKIKKMYTVDRK